MSDGNPPEATFSTNRAYQRFIRLIEEQFDVLTWTQGDGDPVFVTLTDLATGDTISLAYLDSLEIDTPAALLTWTGGLLAAHGPFDGLPAARQYGFDLAMADRAVAVTQPIPLLPPADRDITTDTWQPVMPSAMTGTRAAVCDTPTVVTVLHDPVADTAVCAGPFLTTVDARAWRPVLDRDANRLVLPLRRPATAPPGIAALMHLNDNTDPGTADA